MSACAASARGSRLLSIMKGAKVCEARILRRHVGEPSILATLMVELFKKSLSFGALVCRSMCLPILKWLTERFLLQLCSLSTYFKNLACANEAYVFICIYISFKGMVATSIAAPPKKIHRVIYTPS